MQIRKISMSGNAVGRPYVYRKALALGIKEITGFPFHRKGLCITCCDVIEGV